MREIPILFSTPMVQAILNGNKTMTRRICKLDIANFDYDRKNKNYGPFLQDKYGDSIDVKTLCPYGQPGDRLWVRETWNGIRLGDKTEYWYKADEPEDADNGVLRERWRPSIHMPRKAARIFLEVVNVRVERLQEITASQIIKEGLFCGMKLNGGICGNGGLCAPDEDDVCHNVFVSDFVMLWNSTIKKQDLHLHGWDASPWVWVIEFGRIE